MLDPLNLALNIVGAAFIFGVFILAAALQIRSVRHKLEKKDLSLWHRTYLRLLIVSDCIFIVLTGGAALYFIGKVLPK